MTEQKYVELTRNYNRRESNEMYSLTMSRLVDLESSFYRMRLENYLLLYDVKIQVLEEMYLEEFIVREYLVKQKIKLAKQMRLLLEMMDKEFADLPKSQQFLHMETLEDVYVRVGDLIEKMNFKKPDWESMMIDDMVEGVRKKNGFGNTGEEITTVE